VRERREAQNVCWVIEVFIPNFLNQWEVTKRFRIASSQLILRHTNCKRGIVVFCVIEVMEGGRRVEGEDIQQKVVIVDMIAIALAVRPSITGIEHLSFPPLTNPYPISDPASVN
jgi:hypothetical protein